MHTVPIWAAYTLRNLGARIIQANNIDIDWGENLRLNIYNNLKLLYNKRPNLKLSLES